MSKEKDEIVLSVRLMVYNNLPFIKETLDGVVQQQTNFRFEVVIGDDFSTDGTFEILQDYQAKYPDLIRILDRPLDGTYKKERASLGRIHNFVDIVNNCKGRYIAILDGDDFWTDPLKLQKQVDFLEANEDYNICYHQCSELFEDGAKKLTNLDEPESYDISYLVKIGWHIRSVAIVFRKSALPTYPKWVYTIQSMDYATQCLLTMHGGKIKCMKENMGIYRIHGNTVSAKINKSYLEILDRNIYLLSQLASEVKHAKVLSLFKAKIFEVKNILFYQLKAKKPKSLKDLIKLVSLGFEVKILKA